MSLLALFDFNIEAVCDREAAWARGVESQSYVWFLVLFVGDFVIYSFKMSDPLVFWKKEIVFNQYRIVFNPRKLETFH